MNLKINDSKLLFVNSLSGSGVGDFGKAMFVAIDPEHVQKEYVNSNSTWASFFSNWHKILKFRGKILINLGFTSYGKSPVVNFVNFFLIFISARVFAKKLQVILHDSPDLTSKETSGYKHFTLIKIGGTIATYFLKNLQVYVFSETLFYILRNKYGFEKIVFHPFPCLAVSKKNSFDDKSDIIVLSIGYIAPYKGLELTRYIKEIIPNVEFIISGVSHPVLSRTVNGISYFNNLISNLVENGIDVRGYISESEIAELTDKRRVIGILPYLVTSGSSYAATFFIERGIPVIASNLPEFRVLYNHGAGIILCERNAIEFANEIDRTRVNLDLYCNLVKRNIEYCSNYSITNFLIEIGLGKGN